jgi:hypothetical protein
VASCCKHGDEPSGSGSTELVLVSDRKVILMLCHFIKRELVSYLITFCFSLVYITGR